jgi:UDP-3-O-[3-hydroxymyristoyl] glucosamine N-acyltransferase
LLRSLEGEVEGNPDVEVQTVSKIEEGEKGSLTFLSNQKYTPYIYKTNASITIVNDTPFVPEKELSTTLIKVPDAYGAFSKLLSPITTVLRKPNLELSLRVISIMKLPMGKTCI